MGTQAGLRKLVLPQPSPRQTLQLLSEFSLRWFDDSPSEAEAGYFNELPDRIRDYLRGRKVSFPDRLDLSRASNFHRSVWEVARSIPYGETRTYGWVANKLNKPGAARAVGQALAKNPLPVIIPCHRVICNDGNFGGYSSGMGWKQRLLEIEKNMQSAIQISS